MAKNCLRITHQGDTIQLSWQRGQASPRFADAVTFEHPFDQEALTDLRWYLEEYLRFPYGIFPENAAKIEQKLQNWGEQLFQLVFRSSEKGREFFQAATYEGLHNCELVITADDSKVLNLPWELLYSPSDRQFLAPSLAGMSRSLSEYAVRAEMGELPQDKLNILLVIARPYGETDIALKTIARPLLDSLAQIRQKVNLKVLRPPSFDEFQRELSANKGFYHIVHFDGHGDFDPNSQGFHHTLGGVGQGVLLFEALDGSPQVVTAAQIAQNLADCGVPIFVLNACKSAREGEENFSSVASRLVSLGAKGVVAMAYKVYAVAARHFIGRLYGELVRGGSIAHAVAAGRKAILNHPQRPSPKGDKVLRDWLVPVLYQQEPYTPFIVENNTDIPDIDDFVETLYITSLHGFPEVGAYGFIGRDYDILRLERAFRQNNIVLLQGMGGVGKTELSCGFGRWLEETQGRAGKLFFISFEHGATLINVINQVGREVWGDKFSQYSTEQQQAAVLKYLQTQPCLLIWDNFEPVNGFPTGNEPLLTEEERKELKGFLKALRGGKSWVLITSRREESWLDCGYTLLNLGGLREEEVEELAGKILQTAGVDKGKLPKEYLELLKLLGGHPLSLRVVLPHLKTQTPLQLIEALRQGLDTFAGEEEEGRDKSLTVSLDYSFSKLSEKARRHLPFLGLFSERVNAHWLYHFSGIDEYAQAYQAYQAVFGENLQTDDWLAILNEAAAASIVEHLGYDTVYKIHPALPWFLRKRLKTIPSLHNEEVINELEKNLLIFYGHLANYYYKKLMSDGESATLILRIEEPNLLQNLRLAEQEQQWKSAWYILAALGKLYKRLGHKPELKALQKRALNQIGIHLTQAKAKGKDAFDFWMYLRNNEANEAWNRTDLEAARAIHQEILDELIPLNDSSVNGKIAICYHQLGNLAFRQRQFEEAQQYYLKALKIKEDAGDFYNAASDYHQLGHVVQEKRQFEQASQYYLKALKIYEDAGDLYQAAAEYHHLGTVAEQQQQFEQAKQYYLKALKITEDSGDFYNNITIVYHQLGVVAEKQQQFEQAKQYYFKALKIREDAGNFYNAASDYHQLGNVAYQQRQFEDAQQYYLKALKIYEDAGDFYKAADEYHQLGMVAQEQRQFEQAISYYQTAFGVFEQFQDWYSASQALGKWGKVLEAQSNFSQALAIYIHGLDIGIKHYQEFIEVFIYFLAGMLQTLGENEFDAIWREVTGGDCAGEVRQAIWAARDGLNEQG
ncbi:MAG: tetratricopeptide repeat protein [Calothrix sp. MO_192.B10]|nr:tetratricopeptide repeat protein [Calothrix sp. MO_192.B10]